MSKVRITRGTEGPRFDPYSYENITVVRSDGTKATMHLGLGIWCEVVHANGMRYQEHDPEQAAELFGKAAGITPRAAERAHREMLYRPYRFHPCGQSYLKGVDGYPGEHLVLCGKCGDVLEVQFSISEVV